METAIIVLGILLGAVIIFAFWLCRLYIAVIKERQTETEANRKEREELINQHIKDRENLAQAFNADREQLTDKLLKRNGVSPVYDKKPVEPVHHRIESNLTRNARLKRESK